MKLRLSIMNFLEFAVWGAYLTCMGNYLGVAGLGDTIAWFYAIQGIVSIFMPTLMGIGEEPLHSALYAECGFLYAHHRPG